MAPPASHPDLGANAVSTEEVAAPDGPANVADQRSAAQSVHAGRVAPAAALASLGTSGLHANDRQASDPEGSADTQPSQPSSMGRAVPRVTNQSTQPGAQSDAARADLPSAAAATSEQGEEHDGAGDSSREVELSEAEESDEDGGDSGSDIDDSSELTPAQRRRWVNGQTRRILQIVRATLPCHSSK